MMGNAPFESLEGEHKSIQSVADDYEYIKNIGLNEIWKHKKLNVIKVLRLYDDIFLNEKRYAIIAEMGFKRLF